MKIWKNLGSLFARQTAAPRSLNKQAYRENFESQTGLAHTIARKAFTNSRVLTGACLLAFFGQTAHAQSLPVTPTDVCTWNWNRWFYSGDFARSRSNQAFNPATYGASPIDTAFGTDMWYQTPPDVNLVDRFTGLADGEKPTENTVDTFGEVFYGIGTFVSAPNTVRTIEMDDSGFNEGHVIGIFDSSGAQIGRFPSGPPSALYLTSDVDPRRTSPVDGINRPSRWSDTFTFTVPADGQYTMQYIVIDEGAISNIVTTNACQLPPEANDDEAINPRRSTPTVINPLADNGSGADTDDDGTLDPTSVMLIDPATGNPVTTLAVAGQGTWDVNATSGAVTFTPDAALVGDPTPVAYTVADNEGVISNQARMTIVYGEVTAANDGPIALDGTNGDTSSASVLDNDTLNGSPITDPSLVTLTPGPLPTPAAGSIALNPDGTVTVAAGTTPGTYTIDYEICDVANPARCATAQVQVVVVDVGTGLINEIEEDLVTILENDLADTLTLQSNQIGGYSANALDRLRNRGQGGSQNSCLADVNARLAVENILFDTDKAIIKPRSNRTLDDIAAILMGCPGSAFEIAGHTDSDASDAYNIDLSQRRVVAVRQALAARGVDTSGYAVRGYGESQPIASNATAQGKARNRRVEFLPLGGAKADHGSCDNSFSLTRSLNANTTEDGTTSDGQFMRDQHNCITDRREVFEGSLSYLDTDQGQTQAAINLSYRREQYRQSDSVLGYFVGLYGSRSEVTDLATGEINGFGLNAGIYGANRFENALFVDYYLAAAAGRHSFDLAFERAIGTVNATGDYQYLAGFAGAALSGEVALGDTTLAPRVGFDYAYTPGADVDAVAELNGLTEADNLDLDAIAGGRIFAELRADQLIQNDTANLWVNPRVACYQSLGALDGVCGVGGSVGIESAVQDNGLTYAVELDGEWGEDYTQGSLSMRAARQIGIGTLSGDAGVTRNGAGTLATSYDVKF